MTKVLAALAILFAAGCDLYFTGDDTGDDVCNYGTGGGAAEPYYELRNPYTGQCEYQGGGYPCDGVCGPCPATTDVDVADPDWGACYGKCSGLDEQSCYATSGCYAAYLENTAIDDAQPTREFWGCWDTAPSGPVQGQCLGLDGHECSRHDDCIAVYDGSSFLSCEPELVPQPPGCAAIDCGPGYTCEEVCTTDPMNNPTCTAQCVALAACETLTTEQACTSRADCTPVYDGYDCTCYPDHCECQTQTFARCETP